jgi:hypothetical protein
VAILQRLTVPRWLPYAALALVGWLARGAYDRPDPEARANYQALARHAALHRRGEDRRHASDSLALLHEASLRAASAASRHRQAALALAASHLTDTVRILLPDTSARALFDSLGALHARELTEKDVQIAAERARASLFKGRWAAANRSADSVSADLHEAVAQLDVATRQRRLRRCGPGLGAGWGLRGPDLLVGVACRL